MADLEQQTKNIEFLKDHLILKSNGEVDFDQLSAEITSLQESENANSVHLSSIIRNNMSNFLKICHIISENRAFKSDKIQPMLKVKENLKMTIKEKNDELRSLIEKKDRLKELEISEHGLTILNKISKELENLKININLLENKENRFKSLFWTRTRVGFININTKEHNILKMKDRLPKSLLTLYNNLSSEYINVKERLCKLFENTYEDLLYDSVNSCNSAGSLCSMILSLVETNKVGSVIKEIAQAHNISIVERILSDIKLIQIPDYNLDKIDSSYMLCSLVRIIFDVDIVISPALDETSHTQFAIASSFLLTIIEQSIIINSEAIGAFNTTERAHFMLRLRVLNNLMGLANLLSTMIDTQSMIKNNEQTNLFITESIADLFEVCDSSLGQVHALYYKKRDTLYNYDIAGFIKKSEIAFVSYNKYLDAGPISIVGADEKFKSSFKRSLVEYLDSFLKEFIGCDIFQEELYRSLNLKYVLRFLKRIERGTCVIIGKLAADNLSNAVELVNSILELLSQLPPVILNKIEAFENLSTVIDEYVTGCIVNIKNSLLTKAKELKLTGARLDEIERYLHKYLSQEINI